MWDYKQLADLKSGLIVIDVLTKDCTHNNMPIKSLKIAEVLQIWLYEDMDEYGLPKKAINMAQVTVEFNTERHLGQRNLRQSWRDPTPYFISCQLHCNSVISTGESTYAAFYNDEEEWPESYSCA